jgi:septal ring factor EnvC (AmiA/AmiB activator)
MDNAKSYQQKISHLDSELKMSGVRIKNMEDEIDVLNKKIKTVEIEKEKYKGRLYTETSGDRNYDFDLRQFSEYNEVLAHSETHNRPRFKIKDLEANEVFERKVIY